MNNSVETIHTLSEEEACRLLDSGPMGLSTNQVSERQQKYGRNVLAKKKRKTGHFGISFKLCQPNGDFAVGWRPHRVRRRNTGAWFRNLAGKHY